MAVATDLDRAGELPPPSAHHLAIGVDFGGTGIKGGIVDLRTGQLVGERYRIDTPQPATPEAVIPVIAQIVDTLQQREPAPEPEAAVGLGFPAIIKDGRSWSATNIDDAWIGADLAGPIQQALGRPVHVVNDADAVGLAEAIYGEGRHQNGLVMTITLGTGIGSAIVHNGVLVPNLELGAMELDGTDAEARASVRAREREGLSWEEYGVRLQRFFSKVQRLFTPDLFVVGGGVSRKPEKFMPYLDLKTPIVPAALQNNAGIVGAVLFAAGQPGERERRDRAADA
ncbi:ROK family protein [Rothia sp. AR01]|uniref:ROK family protein n=1 Tax=Rothia santali TaxID=2949643 RepID=A0A9X2HE41_9MICC|nr:ROK family protein [Rothia santali]MCP3425539.1 ROK family protein [Rothia santali]